MSIFNSIWNSAASYFPTTVKHGANKDFQLIANNSLAYEIGFIAVKSVEAAVEKAGEAVIQAPATAYQWAGAAGEAALTLGHAAVKGTHGWYFQQSTSKNAAPQADKGSATLFKELALQMPQDALKGTHDWYFEKAADAPQESNFAMAMNLTGAFGSAALKLGHAALKTTHAWQFGSDQAAEEKSSASMALDLTTAAGSKAVELGYQAYQHLQGWLYGSTAPDAATSVELTQLAAVTNPVNAWSSEVLPVASQLSALAEDTDNEISENVSYHTHDDYRPASHASDFDGLQRDQDIVDTTDDSDSDCGVLHASQAWSTMNLTHSTLATY